MSFMFNHIPSYMRDLSAWNISQVTNMTHMFSDDTTVKGLPTGNTKHVPFQSEICKRAIASC